MNDSRLERDAINTIAENENVINNLMNEIEELEDIIKNYESN